MTYSPPFGQADLSNCERELIHLPGSIQPHGVLLVIERPSLKIIRVSDNSASLLDKAPERLLGQSLSVLTDELSGHLATFLESETPGSEPWPFQVDLGRGDTATRLEGVLHCASCGAIVLELMPARALPANPVLVTLDEQALLGLVSEALKRFALAANIGALANDAARAFRDLTGYDRVMIYKFDPEGHGQIIAEARDPRLDSLLGHRYPATDIPQRARELYIRNRVRVLVDVNYQAASLVPGVTAGSAQELDMSMCYLRSMSPLHLQYLKNMGVRATLVTSLVRNGRLWGLVAAHHDSPRNLSFAVRAATALMSESIATRIAAIENYAHARVAIQVRRLQQRLVEATSSEGDWRLALFRNPNTLLRPLEATGAVLYYDGTIQTAGEVPSTPELRHLQNWLDQQIESNLYSCASIGTENPKLASLTSLASGVLAVRLSTARPEFIVWLRKEQLDSVTWAGDPAKPMISNDPLELSPRRSFAAWSEIVRGKAMPWSEAEISMANAFGNSLIDIIVQIDAVRLLIAQSQITEIRDTIDTSREPVVIFDTLDRLLFCNACCRQLLGKSQCEFETLDAFLAHFQQGPDKPLALDSLLAEGESWRGDVTLQRPGAQSLPVRLRVDSVPGPAGKPLGLVFTIVDLSTSVMAAQARARLEQSLDEVSVAGANAELTDPPAAIELLQAIVANASMAAMDIADAITGEPAAPTFTEVEQSTRRANRLHALILASFRNQ